MGGEEARVCLGVVTTETFHGEIGLSLNLPAWSLIGCVLYNRATLITRTQDNSERICMN